MTEYNSLYSLTCSPVFNNGGVGDRVKFIISAPKSSEVTRKAVAWFRVALADNSVTGVEIFHFERISTPEEAVIL